MTFLTAFGVCSTANAGQNIQYLYHIHLVKGYAIDDLRFYKYQILLNAHQKTSKVAIFFQKFFQNYFYQIVSFQSVILT